MMDIELSTLEDIVNELRRRRIQFVLIGIEPSNQKRKAVQVGASAEDLTAVLRLMRLGRSSLEEDRFNERRNHWDKDQP